MKKIPYAPITGWFDLSQLNLPKKKFEAYRPLQVLGEQYQKTIQYQKKYNKSQLEKLKELCAEMNIDLILNYGALDNVAQGRGGEQMKPIITVRDHADYFKKQFRCNYCHEVLCQYNYGRVWCDEGKHMVKPDECPNCGRKVDWSGAGEGDTNAQE
jgi:hypothetical protein